MAKGGDRADHGVAVADCGPKSLRFGQGGVLLARAGGGRPAARGNKVGGVLKAEFFMCWQGLRGGLRYIATVADSARCQKRATPKSARL